MADCYTCKHRGTVPGSAHSECNVVEEKMMVAVYVMKNGCKYPALELNPHGVRNGWCNWPLDFDPCWVDRCDFYEAKNA